MIKVNIKSIFRYVEGFEIEKIDIDIESSEGKSFQEKQNNIKILHQKFNELHKYEKIIEISTKSNIKLGRELSAFNLKYDLDYKEYPLECVFQSSKVFEKGERLKKKKACIEKVKSFK